MILLDSSFLIAYIDKRDKNHDDAVRKQIEIDNGRFGSIAITDYIFDEVMTIMLKTIGIEKASGYGEKILKIAEMKKVEVSIFDSSWIFFKEQKGTRFSFTDCTSIVACRTYGISTICTFDEEFNKVRGFTVIK